MIDKFENRIQMLSLTVTFANLGTGVIMKIPKESAQFASNSYLDGVVVEVLLVAVNLSVMLALAGKFVGMFTISQFKI